MAMTKFDADGLATGHYAQTSIGEQFLYDKDSASKGKHEINSFLSVLTSVYFTVKSVKNLENNVVNLQMSCHMRSIII